MKKILLLLSSIALFAGEYITLENGKVIFLKDDGTWQEVNVVKKGGETIAIKPDGTWEKIESKKIEAANKLETAVDKKYKDNPLVKGLLGKWRGDGIFYSFTADKAFLKIKSGHTYKSYSGKWTVEKMDEKNRILKINIAEGARLGFLTFGGDIREIKFINENTIEDITDKLEGKIYTLHRVR